MVLARGLYPVRPVLDFRGLSEMNYTRKKLSDGAKSDHTYLTVEVMYKLRFAEYTIILDRSPSTCSLCVSH